MNFLLRGTKYIIMMALSMSLSKVLSDIIDSGIRYIKLYYRESVLA
jgi:hypothetical protein